MVYNRRLDADQLFKKCPPEMFSFNSTEEVIPLEMCIRDRIIADYVKIF